MAWEPQEPANVGDNGDLDYAPPPSLAWVFQTSKKRRRQEDDGYDRLSDVDAEPGADDDDDDAESIAGVEQMPDAKTDPYCYLCEAASTPNNPDLCRDKIMTFLRTQARELKPELLCECAVVFYNNSVAAELLAGDPMARPRKFTAAMVYEHITRHMLDPAFAGSRIVRVLMAYDDMFTRTMQKKNGDGQLLAPDAEATKTHLKVLEKLSTEMRMLAKNGIV